MLGAILFHFDYCIVHDINVGEKYPLFTLYHCVLMMIFIATIFNLVVK